MKTFYERRRTQQHTKAFQLWSMVVPTSLSALLVLALGYAYPAYLTFKALEKRKPEALRAWCEYWCARSPSPTLQRGHPRFDTRSLTPSPRQARHRNLRGAGVRGRPNADVVRCVEQSPVFKDSSPFLAAHAFPPTAWPRLPLYHETKVFFVVWLWHPRTQGAAHCYAAYVAPLLRAHEPTVDAHLADAGSKVGGFAADAYARASGYARTRFLQFVDALPHEAAAPPPPRPGSFSPRNAHEAAASAFMAKAR